MVRILYRYMLSTVYVDINVKGKNLGYKGDTKGEWPDFKIRFDFEPEDIVNSGRVK